MSTGRSSRSSTTRSRTEAMLKSDTSDQTLAAQGRIGALDRARTFITLLVLLHHSVVNYTRFGNGDRARWLGFDLIVLFNDSFFMAFMFLRSEKHTSELQSRGLISHAVFCLKNNADVRRPVLIPDAGLRLLVSPRAAPR